MLLIDQMGMEGYGIFWALIERLRNEKEYRLPISTLNALAKRWGTSREKVETVIKNYGLFFVENDFFYSERLRSSMILKTEKARESAGYRWKNATALPSHTDRNANGMRKDANKVKESKGKERKGSRGVRFDEKGENVLFPDGTSQPLGQTQSMRMKEGDFKPHYVQKGVIE